MRMTHPKLDHTKTDPVEVTEREFRSVWSKQGWEAVGGEPAADEAEDRGPVPDRYDDMDVDELKGEATVRGIDFASNIGADKLRERLREADAADEAGNE